MDREGLGVAVPERDPDMEEAPFLDFQANYVLRSLDQFPKQGSEHPWRVHQNYARDVLPLRYGSLTEAMRFEPRRTAPVADTARRAPEPIAA